MGNEELYGIWLPADLSTQGAPIDSLINILHVFMVVLFVGWAIFMAYCLWQYRARPGHKAKYNPTKGTLSKYIEIGIVAIEVFILLVLSIPAWSDLKAELPEESEALIIRVMPQQFAWNIHYPGPDGVFGETRPDLIDETLNPLGLNEDDPAGEDDIVTLNQLCIPAGRPVIIRLSSRDVIHSFWIPVLRVKQDAIPGMEIKIWFEAKEEAAAVPNAEGSYDDENVYEIVCAQLCGLNHYSMRGFVRIRDEAGFEAWLEEQGEEEFFDEDEFDE